MRQSDYQIRVQVTGTNVVFVETVCDYDVRKNSWVCNHITPRSNPAGWLTAGQRFCLETDLV